MNNPDNSLLHIITTDVASRYKVVPYAIAGTILTLKIDENSLNDSVVGELELITGYQVELMSEPADVINQLISKLYRKDLKAATVQTLSTITEHSEDFLTKIINDAKELKSSDIHIEGYAGKCRIRLRIDGKLVERYQIPKDQYASFINKIKIKAGLDIAEKRLPQDGRILINNQRGRTDIRVSVLPSLYSEKVVLRLLGSDSSHINIHDVGFSEVQLNDFLRTLKKPQGIILISGPTGSGKTTTLYATLKLLNNESINILTVEDPIEYTLDGITQVQLRENIGLTFSSTLRTFLRQDPDIIMLGEIRDVETAQMAIRAALTGHLVLSTIHTNSAWGTISRLVDMGIPTFLLASTINMTIAQRLIRKLCIHCKKETTQKEAFSDISDMLSGVSYHFVSVGCEKCFYTGYSGRAALYEVIPVDDKMSALIKENVLDISKELKDRSIHTLQDSALALVKKGITSIEEIYPILLKN